MINLKSPEIKELKPKITVFGVGGAGGNAVNNMIRSGLEGCEFVVANTDSQALTSSRASRLIQMGVAVTEGLGAGSQPEIGRAAAEEVIDEIMDHLSGSHMIFVTAGMGGGTGTGAAPIIARTAREQGILTVGVVTKPFHFEGQRRMRVASAGIEELQQHVDTLIVIPNQNLFRIATDKTTFADAFAMADQVLYSGVACITDLMVKEGLINLDFADVRSVMREMGKAMMGTGEASGASRATQAAEAAIANPLLDETSMKGAKGLLISITGGKDLTLFEVDEAASRIREEVDQDANIILGATFDELLEGVIRVSVVATGIDSEAKEAAKPGEQRMTDMTQRLKTASQPSVAARTPSISTVAPVRPAAAVAAAPAQAPQPAVVRATPTQVALQAVAEAVAAPAPMPAQAGSLEEELEIRPAATASVTSIRSVAETAAPVAEQAAGPSEAAAAYAPQQADMPANRMPRIEDFPPVVQAEIRVHQRQAAEATHQDRGALGLLKRLAQVGLGRRDEEEFVPPPPRQTARPAQAPARPAMPPQARPAPAAPQPPRQVAAQQPAPRPAAPRPAPQDGLYRPRQAELDAHGRPMPRSDEDPLEIPAFLRRQAN